jgi:hypothetical protein
MIAARDLLNCLAAIGARIEPSVDNLIVRAGSKPIPGALIRQLREAKAEVIALIAVKPTEDDNREHSAGAAWWRGQFAARSVHWSLDGHREWQEAERLAFGDMIIEWHRRHGACPDPRRCAGCGEELSDGVGIVVDHGGARVHFDAARRIDCIVEFGQKWRGAAVAGLRMLGVNPPAGFELL